MRSLLNYCAYLVVFVLVGCSGNSTHELTGVVQSSTLMPASNGNPAGWVLVLGPSGENTFVFIQVDVLVTDTSILMQLATLPPAAQITEVFSLGNLYIGKKIRVTGDVQTDAQNKRYIWVKSKQQIEFL
jgi:hypothetical protein